MRSRRPAVLACLAAMGFAISAYLTAFQLGLVGHVWDPLFGSGSERVLTSGVSRLLPVPDASLGAAAYVVEALLAVSILAGLGPRELVLGALAVIASLGAIVGLGLAALQPIAAGTFCSLCLTSTAISVALAVGALAEVRAMRHPDPRRRARDGDRPRPDTSTHLKEVRP
jgi:hypothetical protein